MIYVSTKGIQWFEKAETIPQGTCQDNRGFKPSTDSQDNFTMRVDQFS